MYNPKINRKDLPKSLMSSKIDISCKIPRKREISI